MTNLDELKELFITEFTMNASANMSFVTSMNDIFYDERYMEDIMDAQMVRGLAFFGQPDDPEALEIIDEANETLVDIFSKGVLERLDDRKTNIFFPQTKEAFRTMPSNEPEQQAQGTDFGKLLARLK